jgi:hypothetical protein
LCGQVGSRSGRCCQRSTPSTLRRT